MSLRRCALAGALLAAVASAQCATPLLNPATCCYGTAPDEFRVVLTLSVGTVTLNVTRASAPLGADRFWAASRCNYWGNTTLAGNEGGLFRVIPNFVIQWGIAGQPAVTAEWDTVIADDPVVLSNLRGTVAFATAGPNTRTTQLFINLADNSHLDAQGFAPFATVSEADTATFETAYAGYGEEPDQDQITTLGDKYLHSKFPKLSWILSSEVVV